MLLQSLAFYMLKIYILLVVYLLQNRNRLTTSVQKARHASF